MSKNIVDKLKLKSGEYYDFKPEGYDELVAKVKELKTLASNGSGGGSGSGSSYIVTTNDIVDKLKLKSGMTYNFKPEGYDELVATVEELMDQAGLIYEDNTEPSNDNSNNTVENHHDENVAAGELAYLSPEESPSSSSSIPLTPFVPNPDEVTFDWEDGDLKVYENGESMAGLDLVTLFSKPIDSVVFDSDTYTLGTEEEVVNGVSRRFALIDKHVIPGTYNIKANCTDGTTETVKINILDRKFTPKFKDAVRQIRINRSSEHNFNWIMDHNYLGTYLTQSNLITYTLDYFDIPSDCKVDTTEQYLYSKIHFKLNNMTEGSPYKNILIGNAVELVRLNSSNGQWCFRDSTWKKDQTDTLTLMFGDVEYDQITISTYDSNPDMIYVRKISDENFNHWFNVNQEYTLRDLFGFYPFDARFSLIMSSFRFSDYNSSELEFTVKSSSIPTSWKDFYDNYMRVKVLKKGLFNCYVHWATTDGIGGKMLIYLRGVTDGSGKPSSSSGPLN